jgi:adenylate cyclase class IV
MNKQETLEEYEAAIIKFPEYDQFLERIGFEEGAKWQQEKSYSEEEVKTAFLDGWQLRDGDLPFSKAMKKWFEQFKKE